MDLIENLYDWIMRKKYRNFEMSPTGKAIKNYCIKQLANGDEESSRIAAYDEMINQQVYGVNRTEQLESVLLGLLEALFYLGNKEQ